MALNTKQIDEYTAQAKEIWGETTAFKEFKEKNKGRTAADHEVIASQPAS